MTIDEHTYNIGFHLNVLFYFVLIRNQNWNRKVCYIRVCLSRCVCVSTEQLPHQLILPKEFYLSTILSPKKSIYNCHFWMLNWNIAWSPNLLLGPWHVRERQEKWEQSQQGGCPRSRRVLSAGQDSSLHCPSLSDWQWHHDISCPDPRWRRPATLAYLSRVVELRSSQHLLSSPFTTLSAWRSETDDANTVRGNTGLAEIVRRLYVYIHQSTKIFSFKSPICNTLLCRRHYVYFMYLLVSTVPSEMTKHQK